MEQEIIGMLQEIIGMLQEINPYVDIDGTSLLLEEEILDSIGIVLLIEMLEEWYKISIPLEKIKKEDFQTVNQIVNLIKQLI